MRAAIHNSGFEFPQRRITVSLAPADLRKEGPAYDLPIAVGILIGSGQASALDEDAVFLGELALDWSLQHTQGLLPMVGLATDEGYRTAYVPAVDAREAALVEGATVLPVDSLARLARHLRGDDPITPFHPDGSEELWMGEMVWSHGVDMADIKGQEHVKRALEVAAAATTTSSCRGHRGAGRRFWHAGCHGSNSYVSWLRRGLPEPKVD